MLAGRGVDIKLLYNPGDRKFELVGEKMLEWGTCHREAGPLGPRLSSPEERERNAVMAIRVGVNMLQFCSVSNSLSHITLSIKWEVYFSKRSVLLVFIASLYFCMHMYMYYVAIPQKSDKIKRNFFQAAIGPILLYGCTAWTLTRRIGKKSLGIAQECYEVIWTNPRSNTLRNNSCKVTYPTISKTIEVRQTRHAGPRDPNTWTCQCWPTRKNFFILAQ